MTARTKLLKVGLQLPEVEREVRWPELRDMARLAEEVGFDSLWVGDHLLYRRGSGTQGPWEAWSLLAALAEVTTSVDIGPLVASTSFHAPAMLAKKAATVDEISGGRLILGLGAGWNETEYRAFGFPYDRRVSRFEEAFTIIRTLLREGEIDFEGEHYTARDCELVPRARPDIPLMIGSHRPRMLRIAASHVELWNTWFAWFGNDPEKIAPLLWGVDEACADVGRDPAEIKRTVAVLAKLDKGVGRVAGDPDRGMSWTPLVGSTEDLAEGLRSFAAAGISQVQMVLDPITLESIESFGAVLAVLD